MFRFIVADILLIAVGLIIYLAVRALPRIQEDPAEAKNGFLDRWVTSEIPEKVDAAINSFLAKFFRKSKVILLRLDNYLGERLKKVARDNGAKEKPAIDFAEITEQNKDSAVAEDNKSSENKSLLD